MKFTSNPNGKLFPNVFQDVRMPNEKYTVGNVLQILYRSQTLGYAKVVAERTFPYNRLVDTFSFMNCGKHAAYQASIISNMYASNYNLKPDTRLVHVVMQWTERNTELFESMLTEWWQGVKCSTVKC